MREYWFSLTCVLPYKGRIVDSVLIRENTDGSVKTPVVAYFMQCNRIELADIIFLFNIVKYSNCFEQIQQVLQCISNHLQIYLIGVKKDCTFTVISLFLIE